MKLMITLVCIVFAPYCVGMETEQPQKIAAKRPAKTKQTKQKRVTIAKVSGPMFDVVEKQPTSNNYLNYAKASYQQVKAAFQRTGADYYLQEALKNYQKVLAGDQSVYPLEGMIRLLFDCGHYQKIVELYEKRQQEFDVEFSNNIEMQMTIAQSLLMLNKNEKAEQIFAKLVKEHPDSDQVAYHTALAYINEFAQEIKNPTKETPKKYAKSQKFLDQCIKKKSLKKKHFLFYFLKSKLALLNNKKQDALTYIEESLKLSRFERGVLFRAYLLEELAKIDGNKKLFNEAIKGYKDYLNVSGGDESIEKQLIQLLYSQKRFKEAAQYLKNLKNDSAEGYFDLALIERQSDRLDSALENINKAIEKNPNFTRAYILKVEILLASKKIQELSSFMESWIGKNPEDHAVLHTLLLLKHVGVERQVLISILENVAKNKESIGVCATLADLNVEERKYKTSLGWYKKVFALASDNPGLRSKTLFYIGYLYFLAKNTASVEKFLKQALTHEPVYPPTYNLLAYHYAQIDKNLDEALTLAEKALNIEPDNYYYLDTKGFILFKLGKREEAIKSLEMAQSLALDDKVIAEHLAMAKGEAEPTINEKNDEKNNEAKELEK